MKRIISLYLFFVACGALSVEDRSLQVTNIFEAVTHEWPDLNSKPTKAVHGCREELYKIVGISEDVQFLYDTQYLSFCRFNEYRMSMYLECAKTLRQVIRKSGISSIPSFCNHSQGFSKNDYKNYTTCLWKIANGTDLYGGFVSSVCEDSKGKQSVVDCVIASVGKGRDQTGSLNQLLILDECMKK